MNLLAGLVNTLCFKFSAFHQKKKKGKNRPPPKKNKIKTKKIRKEKKSKATVLISELKI